MTTDIKNIVSEHFNISVDDIESKSHKREFSTPRQIAHYLARKHTNLTLENIGFLIGKRHYCTVLYSVESITDLLCFDKQIQTDVEIIEKRLNKYNETQVIQHKGYTETYHKSKGLLQ